MKHLQPTGELRATLVRTILRWYSRYGRSFPWRNITKPYRILVSEIMLQQTQTNRVLVKYPLFTRRFPTIEKLAAARQRDVVIEWRGMGYNNRAVRLHQLAKTIVQQSDGKFPHTYDELVELPGVGRYTANALLSSAFGRDVAVVDVNIRRLFSRIFWPMKTTAQTRSERDIWELANRLVPKGRAYDWNQALMDIGATTCTARAPRCEDCPVTRLCSSGAVMKRAVSPQKKKEPSRDGIPNRIYRGRIIEALRRHSSRRHLAINVVGKKIHPFYSLKHRSWLELLLVQLEKDGLIRRVKNGAEQRIALA